MPSKKRKPQKFHKRIKRHHVHATLIMAVLASVVGLFFFTTTRAATCAVAYAVTSPIQGSTVSGSIVLQAMRQSATASSTPVSFQIIAPTPIPLGVASTTDGVSWVLPWSSNSVPDGSYQLATLDSVGCVGPAVSFNVKNTLTSIQPQVFTQIAPTSWAGNTNVATPFMAKAQFRDNNGALVDVSTAAQYHWTTTLGTLAPSGPTANFYSGPTAGSGTVTVSATYNGLTSQAQATVNIFAYVAPTNTTTTTPTATSTSPTISPAPSTSTTTAPTSTTSTAPISSPLDSTTATCLTGELSAAKYQAIIDGKVAASPEQRLLAVKCFAPTFIIPARLAPVDPSGVKQLGVQLPGQLTVRAAKSQSLGTKNSIHLSGKAAPNADVYLYVFSEPLVLKAKSDSAGNWNYSLENPLKPGRHEVYAVTQNSTGTFVRSDAFPIAVAQAAPSGTNPEGNSLQLVGQNNTFLYWYLAAAALVVGFGIRLAFILQRNRRRVVGAV